MTHVYELRDGDQVVVYVGESKDPTHRLYRHTKCKPGMGKGRFYGRTDITMNIVKSFEDRKEARQYEKYLQEKNNLLRTEDKAFRLRTMRDRKLTWEQAQEIKVLYVPGQTTLHGIAEQYGVTRNVISSIIRGDTYKIEDYGYESNGL
jgi:predicted GIY-YIG superfamily endonuclease